MKDKIGSLRARLDDIRDDRHFPAHMLSAHDEMLEVLDEMEALTQPPETTPVSGEGPFHVSRSSDGEREWYSARDAASGVSIPAKDRRDALAMVGALNRAFALHRSTPVSGDEVGSFQERVQPWLIACFGEMIAGDREERNHRFLEEALELVQACGCTASEAHQLVDYVYGRPIGEPHQEVGGVMVTLAALCLANGLNMHANGETELARIWTKVEKIRAKQAAKPKHSPLPEAAALHPTDPAAIRNAALEEAARVAEGANDGLTTTHTKIAAAIRGLVKEVG